MKPRPATKSEANAQNAKGCKGGKIPKGSKAASTTFTKGRYRGNK